MTPGLRWLGFIATTVMFISLTVVIIREPERQDKAAHRHRERALTEGMELYALNCAECHGAIGEGLDENPILNADFVRRKDYHMLFTTIERGRFNTDMAGYSINEGGNLSTAQIHNLVTVIQYGDWHETEQTVVRLDMMPPPTATPTPPPPTAIPTSAPPDDSLPVFEIKPSSSPTSDELPMFEVQATPTPNTSGLPVFEVQPTSTIESDDLPLFEVEPTSRSRSDDLPMFEVQSTNTPTG